MDGHYIKRGFLAPRPSPFPFPFPFPSLSLCPLLARSPPVPIPARARPVCSRDVVHTMLSTGRGSKRIHSFFGCLLPFLASVFFSSLPPLLARPARPVNAYTIGSLLCSFFPFLSCIVSCTVFSLGEWRDETRRRRKDFEGEREREEEKCVGEWPGEGSEGGARGGGEIW